MPASLKWLRVHVQRTAEPGGAIRMTRTVHCPGRGALSSVESCSACPSRFATDRRDRDLLLVCDVPAAEELPVGEALDDSADSPGIVADAMASDVQCVSPELTLRELLQVFAVCGISGAPVVVDGKPVGVISKTDVVRALTTALDGELHSAVAELRVRELMSPVVFTMPPDAPLDRAAAMMAFEGIHRVPILVGDHVVGLLTSIDVLRWMARRGGFVIPGFTVRQ
jgi:CBS domain-containing protein